MGILLGKSALATSLLSADGGLSASVGEREGAHADLTLADSPDASEILPGTLTVHCYHDIEGDRNGPTHRPKPG